MRRGTDRAKRQRARERGGEQEMLLYWWLRSLEERELALFTVEKAEAAISRFPKRRPDGSPVIGPDGRPVMVFAARRHDLWGAFDLVAVLRKECDGLPEVDRALKALGFSDFHDCWAIQSTSMAAKTARRRAVETFTGCAMWRRSVVTLESRAGIANARRLDWFLRVEDYDIEAGVWKTPVILPFAKTAVECFARRTRAAEKAARPAPTAATPLPAEPL